MADPLQTPPMPAPATDVRFHGKLVLIGFGSIGQGVLPVLFRGLGLTPDRVCVLKPTPDASGIARALGVKVLPIPLRADNHAEVLRPLLGRGDFLLNLSLYVCSQALIALCRGIGALYLDTCNEPWPGRYDNPALAPAQRSNYALREELLAMRMDHPGGPTAVVTHGANPGLISTLFKQALLNMAAELGFDWGPPHDRRGWADLARGLDVRVVHVAERDTQIATRRKRRDEFVNTWSVDGFIDEALQPAELGWGTHERHWPADAARHAAGGGAAIYLRRPGIDTRVRSWTPLTGAYQGFLVTHAESITLADHFSLHEAGELVYRPTVHYAYRPCDDTLLSLQEVKDREGARPLARRIARDEIDGGVDELGVLVMGHPRGAYWYGSRLTIAQARALAPGNNATTLQVAAGILGGMVWALRHPESGIVEPEQLDHRTVLDAAMPYLGELVGVWSDWTPLKDRSALFPQPLDATDPWQFINFRVH